MKGGRYVKVTSALSLAARGFRVFPLSPNGKRPAIKAWPAMATTDPGQIEKWWGEDPDYNIGTATGGHFFVVDADAKEGKAGLDSLAGLEMVYDVPQSLRVTTPTGGVHVYLRKPQDLALVSNANKIEGFPGVDIRAEGGFVVAPGSTIDGIPYASDSRGVIADAPDCLFNLLRKPIDKRAADSSVELDLPHHIDRAKEWLVNHAPSAVEGDGGDETTFAVAAEMRAMGLSEDMALELMLEHWNESKASPPWMPDELARKVANGFQYGQGAPGGKTAAGEFDDLSGLDMGAPPSEIRTQTSDSVKASQTITARPYTWADPATLLPRQWVFGRHLIRKFVSVTVAPGSVGKSSLVITEALSMVSGRNLIGHAVEAPLRVWYWNLEDPYDELQRRVQAGCQHFGLAPSDIEGRLFIDSGRDQALRTAVSDKNGARILRPIVDGLVAEMKLRQIDVLIVDPFVSSHAVPENDNPAIDMVAKEWGRVAEASNAAIELVHHSRKQGEDEITAESSRGGKALTDAARDVRVLNRMSKDEAAKGGVENHRLYFRTHSDKPNMAPPADRSDWFKLESVALANGDDVGVVTRWEWPDPFAEITMDHVAKAQAALATSDRNRANIQAADWAGHTVGEVLGMDANTTGDKEKIRQAIRAWVEKGWLKETKVRDEKGKERPVLVAGKPAQESDFGAVE